ncbi:cyclase/dehydrase [Catenulispora acidiphila DSM 44928]|uniref:Cyclase/dehydrase n=1 Tax=Catenulispora acidiphila (strain DSM 44928 / JCM 14897 / NBRC 102108 / NRRL B-24433 / ID139908) TaxID=479433 RepID=C7Q1H6_CATAD|nr:SRPBCC family protein [Catenulispora acidiphila]ACU73705.1 cyclase/dehydrase [Catenulispora acidiphila DSM 44928]
MSDVTKSVDVEVPLRTAYNQWTQFESFPEFMSGVIAIRQLDDRHTHWVTEVAGARREFDAEIVEQLPDERIAWRSVDGDVRHSGIVTFRPLGDHTTRVTVDLEWEPEGLLEKAGGAMGVDRLQVKADLERFRQFIEERGNETGQWRGQVPETQVAAVPTGNAEPLAGTAAPLADAQQAAGPDPSANDVVDVLVAQHAQVKDLMARTAASEGADKQRLFTALVDLIKTHEKGEQRVVHPVTRSSVEGGAATANARLGEEERADQLIAEVKTMTADSPEFDAWFEQLRQAVLDHAEHEEREEFPKLRRELTAARLHTMAEELVAVQTAHN